MLFSLLCHLFENLPNKISFFNKPKMGFTTGVGEKHAVIREKQIRGFQYEDNILSLKWCEMCTVLAVFYSIYSTNIS